MMHARHRHEVCLRIKSCERIQRLVGERYGLRNTVGLMGFWLHAHHHLGHLVLIILIVEVRQYRIIVSHVVHILRATIQHRGLVKWVARVVR